MDIKEILEEANAAVLADLAKLEIEVKDKEDMKLHIKIESAASLVKDEQVGDDQTMEDDAPLSSNEHIMFPGLCSTVEQERNVETDHEIDLRDFEEQMDLDDEHIIQDASGVLEPVKGKAVY